MFVQVLRLGQEERRELLVYVIGLHAVQFGNNWMKKIPKTDKIVNLAVNLS